MPEVDINIQEFLDPHQEYGPSLTLELKIQSCSPHELLNKLEAVKTLINAAYPPSNLEALRRLRNQPNPRQAPPNNQPPTFVVSQDDLDAKTC